MKSIKITVLKEATTPPQAKTVAPHGKNAPLSQAATTPPQARRLVPSSQSAKPRFAPTMTQADAAKLASYGEFNYSKAAIRPDFLALVNAHPDQDVKDYVTSKPALLRILDQSINAVYKREHPDGADVDQLKKIRKKCVEIFLHFLQVRLKGLVKFDNELEIKKQIPKIASSVKTGDEEVGKDVAVDRDTASFYDQSDITQKREIADKSKEIFAYSQTIEQKYPKVNGISFVSALIHVFYEKGIQSYMATTPGVSKEELRSTMVSPGTLSIIAPDQMQKLEETIKRCLTDEPYFNDILAKLSKSKKFGTRLWR